MWCGMPRSWVFQQPHSYLFLPVLGRRRAHGIPFLCASARAFSPPLITNNESRTSSLGSRTTPPREFGDTRLIPPLGPHRRRTQGLHPLPRRPALVTGGWGTWLGPTGRTAMAALAKPGLSHLPRLGPGGAVASPSPFHGGGLRWGFSRSGFRGSPLKCGPTSRTALIVPNSASGVHTAYCPFSPPITIH